jgi:hypothetical protein
MFSAWHHCGVHACSRQASAAGHGHIAADGGGLDFETADQAAEWSDVCAERCTKIPHDPAGAVRHFVFGGGSAGHIAPGVIGSGVAEVGAPDELVSNKKALPGRDSQQGNKWRHIDDNTESKKIKQISQNARKYRRF